MANTRIGILGYGNVGHGVETAVNAAPDLDLAAVFTRRDPSIITTANPETPVVSVNDIDDWQDKVDVLVMGGGSATDLPVQGPEYASKFNIVDSFDTHANIPAYHAKVDQAAKDAGNVAIISTGWDPGLFSIDRLYGEAILPNSSVTTFWGPGVSQGHSDAVRRVNGVKDAVQYTVPIDDAMDKARHGEAEGLTTREKHRRVVYAVPEDGADYGQIEHDIKTMPNYFSDYDTTVNFISQEELDEEHATMPHAGMVIRHGETSDGTQHIMQSQLTLDSNPEFTGTTMAAYARAAHKLAKSGDSGAKTVFDIAPGLLSPKRPEQLRAELL